MAGSGMAAVQAVVCLMMLCGWAIDLAGVGRMVDLCMEDKVSLGSVQGLDKAEREKQCGFETSFLWWTLALQFLCIVMGLVAAFTSTINKGLVTALIAISTVQLSITAKESLTTHRIQDTTSQLGSDLGKANSALFAGKIIQLVFNYIWLVLCAKFVHVDNNGSQESGKPVTAA